MLFILFKVAVDARFGFMVIYRPQILAAFRFLILRFTD
jgi:hypothetical protein